MTFWNIWCSFAVLSYIPIRSPDRPDAWRQPHQRFSLAMVTLRRNPLSSLHRHKPSLPACSPMPPRCASRRVRSMTPQRRSRLPCARPQPRRLVRCAPLRRSVSIVTMNAPWPTCPGRTTACVSSYGCASGFAAIANALAVSSPNGCPPWPLPGRGARCGSPSAWSPSAWLWVGRPGGASATLGAWP